MSPYGSISQLIGCHAPGGIAIGMSPLHGRITPKPPAFYEVCLYSSEECDVELKEWECLQVGHHKDVGKKIEEWQKNGWRLHTYVCAGNANMAMGTVHYLLFEKGE